MTTSAGNSRPASAVRAPAKVNLTLAVAPGPGPDGYHELRGVFARLELADELSITSVGTPTDAAAETLDVVPGSLTAEHPADLILLAAARVRAWAGRPLPALAIGVNKRIPIAAGLAGGSSDGAAALGLVASAWGLEIPAAAASSLALGLGADAPFFLGPSPVALVGGRGEQVNALPAGITGAGILLVVAGGKPSTGDVFAAYDAHPPRSGSQATAATDVLVDALRAGLDANGLAALAGRLRDANDLYPAAARLMPHLATVRETIERALGRPALLSGAGSTLFVIYPSADAAGTDAAHLERSLGELPSGRPEIIATAIAAH
jgi:4-diphosphocytidyl-2-C-methyl-D-erythritol kinase